jgi:hypothetical protein
MSSSASPETKHLRNNIKEVTILTGQAKSESVLVPSAPFLLSLPVSFETHKVSR